MEELERMVARLERYGQKGARIWAKLTEALDIGGSPSLSAGGLVVGPFHSLNLILLIIQI